MATPFLTDCRVRLRLAYGGRFIESLLHNDFLFRIGLL
jgi:hypothetical protein